jgi:hypothetical protein
VKDAIFLLSDLWLMGTCWYFGAQMLRNFGNHLLAFEYLVVAVSSTNFLFWSLLGAKQDSPMYDVAYALDAFSRSFGFTLLLVIGLMTVTHGYKPPLWAKAFIIALATAGALGLGPLHSDTGELNSLQFGVAAFYLVTNLLTTGFLLYFATRLWDAGARQLAVWTAVVTLVGTFIAVTYDFFLFPFDDEHRTFFYTAALTTWGTQGLLYYLGYRALHNHNIATDSKQGESNAHLA